MINVATGWMVVVEEEEVLETVEDICEGVEGLLGKQE